MISDDLFDIRKYKKTFSRVDLPFKKLLSYNVDKRFIRLLRNIYATSALAVKTRDGRSNIFPSNVGLKQGCNMSPLLFNIFINDLLTEINVQFPDSPTLNGIPINGLMYADDLVLFSESEKGLQQLLDILHNYTEKWFLQVNKSKTKYMRICRYNKAPLTPMKFGESVLESTEEYCYLGTTFTNNGSLNKAGKVLHDKAIKAMYGLLGKVNKHNTCSPTVLLELFDKMILPIATYNSEVWGTICFPVNKKNNNLFEVTSGKNPIEDLQVRFCKRVLGVNDRATNWAVTSECGRLPTTLNVMSKMTSFWLHLINSRSPILKAALQTSANLSIRNSNSWFSVFTRILKFLDIEHILYTADPQEVSLQVRKVKHALRKKAEQHWFETHRKVSTAERTKLDLFCHVKKMIGMSHHLVYPLTFTERRAISKFRTSAHNLPVETGRYLGIKDRSQRLCPFCNKGVGDEIHYVTECKFHAFTKLRSPLFSAVSTKFPHFSVMNKADKTVFLLDNTDVNTLTQVGKFAHGIMEVFTEINEGARSRYR